MAVVYVTGAETGLSSANGTGLVLSSPAQSNASIVTSPVKSGTYAHRINNPGASTIGVRCWVNPNVSGVVNFGTWLRLASLPAGDRDLFIAQGTTTGNFLLRFIQASGKLGAADDVAGTIGTWSSCPVLSAGTWYWCAIKVDRTADSVSLTITPDGGSATDCGTINGSNWTGNTGYIGAGSDVAQGAFDCAYDDVVICTGSSEYPLAPHEVLLLLPGSDGTHNTNGTEYIDGDAATTPNFTNSTTDCWTRLDDPLPWSTTRKTTGNVSCEVHTAGTYMEIAPATAASGKPSATAVRALLAYSSVTATANNGSATTIRNSEGTSTTIFGDFTTGVDYSESSNFFKGAIVTAPSGGWTKTEIEALRWRIGRASNSTDISPRPTWQTLGLEIAYPIQTGTTETPTPGGATAGGPAPTAKAAQTIGGASAGGAAPGAGSSVAPGGAATGGPGPTARIAVSQGGAVAGGYGPAAPIQESATPGGALAGGTAPTARASVVQGGATAQGAAPSARASLAQGGATSGGPAPAVRVTFSIGGALAGGFAPTDGGAVTDSPTPGGAVAGGNSPTVRIATARGGATAGGFAPTPVSVLTIQGASTGGFPATVRVSVSQGGALAGGQLEDPLGVKLSPFGPPSPSGGTSRGTPQAAMYGSSSPSRGGAAAGTSTRVSYGKPSPSGGIVRGSPSRRDPNA